MDLTTAQRRQLHEALLAAFSSWEALELALELGLGLSLHHVSSPDRAMPYVAMNLIRWGEEHGRLAEVVEAVRAARPKNPALLAFVRSVLATPLAETFDTPEARRDVERVASRAEFDTTAELRERELRPAAPPPAASRASEILQRTLLEKVLYWDASEWRERLAERERAVCRIEYPAGEGQGTGCLIGADVVLTNYHVLEDFIEGRRPPEEIACRFDVKMSADGVHSMQSHAITLAPAWLVQASSIKALDYVLVRVAARTGEHALEGAATSSPATRGWLTPRAHQFTLGESIFILQHPRAAPLKITSGAVVRVGSTRVFYLANTLGGSSGSPCFNSNWDLVALHRGGDNVSNVGVPFAAILADFTPSTRTALSLP